MYTTARLIEGSRGERHDDKSTNSKRYLYVLPSARRLEPIPSTLPLLYYTRLRSMGLVNTHHDL